MTTLVPNELIRLAAGRVVRVLEAGLGVVVRTPRGNRVGVRNTKTGRLSYIHEDVLLRAKKAAEARGPQPMPTIQVGDYVEAGYDTLRVETKLEAEAWNENHELVVAIYRDPLWRRPAPMPTKGDK